jgi:hypothetical protein
MGACHGRICDRRRQSRDPISQTNSVVAVTTHRPFPSKTTVPRAAVGTGRTDGGTIIPKSPENPHLPLMLRTENACVGVSAFEAGVNATKTKNAANDSRPTRYAL